MQCITIPFRNGRSWLYGYQLVFYKFLRCYTNFHGRIRLGSFFLKLILKKVFVKKRPVFSPKLSTMRKYGAKTGFRRAGTHRTIFKMLCSLKYRFIYPY